MSKRITLFLISFFIHCCALAQQKHIALKRITSQQGLSDNQVTCMLRDKQGFMWIGTKDGLNRFDGRECYVFRHDENNPASLCGNNITTLAYDDDSILWIGTSSAGFCAYDFRTQHFTTYNKDNAGLNSNNINVIRFDKSRNLIWIGYNNGGMQVFDLRKRKFSDLYKVEVNTIYDILFKDTTAYVASIINSLKKANSPDAFQRKKDTGKAAITINCIHNTSNNRLYCGAWDNALHEFDYDTKLLKSYLFDGSDSLNYSADEIISMAEDERGILWCGTKNSGLFFFDLKKKSFIAAYRFEEKISGRVNFIYRDDFSRMWICSNQGIYLYDKLENQFEVTRLVNENENINCKVHQRVMMKSGAEYVATDCGLFYKTKNDEHYSHKNFTYINEELQLTSIYCDDDRIFIGSNKTIFTLDTLKMELKTMQVAAQSVNQGFLSAYASRVNTITSVQLDNRRFVLNSFYGHFVSIIDMPRKNYFWLSRTEPNHIENLVRKIHVDSKKRLWICGASRGLSQFILPVDFHPDSFPVLDTVNHPVYITTNSWENEKSKTPLAINDVYDILENNDGSFWITSQGNGLFKFFPENTAAPFKAFKGDYKSLQGIARGYSNSLWFISSKGLINYNTQTEKYKLYNSKHGIPESTSGYFFNESDSTLSAGFNGGFISFNPQNILKDNEKPKVYVTKLWVLDAPSDSLLTQEITLNHEKNFLKFYLSSNCFSDNEQVTYQYRLTGIDNNWRSNDFSPYITYTNLPPGIFELKYKAINSDGLESDEGVLRIIITPPFYRTLWFYTLVLFAILAAAYIFYRYRIRQILKLQEVRNKIARDLHDDIGSTLGSINLYSQIANSKLNGNSQSEEIKSILEKIESSSGEIIDKTSDVVWAAKASNDTLKNLVMRIEAYSASLLGTAGISFRIIFDESLAETKLGMTERKNIFLIFKEAIHNIIKYAHATEVIISINKKSKRLHIQITDNGKGFPASYNSLSINNLGGNGIKNMKARAEEIKGRFKIESNDNKGTTVQVTL